ncbi:MAG: hypothetical protein QOH49_5244 [Acidobacteriota bacterium]|jgi:uncharacterized protein (DUF1501 family)|nr:hypothetical protein [Acidobacteriota bacterium]
MNEHRRFFLKSSGLALASVGLVGAAPSFLRRVVEAQGLTAAPNGRRKTLITIFQRGAVDGLNMVVPHGERAYYELRPQIAIAQPGSADSAVNLDGFFGLHPSMAPLKHLWDEKRMAIVHAVGSPDNTRSHFDAQDYMESATPGVKSTQDGWLNRYMQVRPDPKATPFRAISMTQNLPRSMQGRAAAVAMRNLSDFQIRAGAYTPGVQGGFEGMYEQSVGDVLRGTGKETFEAVNFLKKVNPAQYKPENGAQYPNGDLGRALMQIAQLIKAGVGLEVAFTDVGGWDTHRGQGGARGQLANLLGQFAQGLSALVTDLGPAHMQDVVVLTMSEFGRTVRQNGTGGTDHGHANAMFVIGGGVRGGKVYGQWPGLKDDQLFEGRDLALTTDFRDVFGEVVSKHLGGVDLKKVFPGYAPEGRVRGILG